MHRRCLIVEDEFIIRDMIGDVAAAEGWTTRSCGSTQDLAERLTPAPDLIFLDIGLNQSDAIDGFDVLERARFGGVVRIVSGQPGPVIDQVRKIGEAKGLRMADPIRKPFPLSEIVQALSEVAEAAPPGVPGEGPVEDRHSWTSWIDPATGQTRARDCVPSASASRLPLEWLGQWCANPPFTSVGPREPWSLALPLALDDVEPLLAMDPQRGGRSLTCVFTEDETFRDVDRSRALFLKLAIRNIRVRVTQCGTRSFSMAGHRALPIDEMVVGDFLRGLHGSAVVRKMRAISELVHRSGALLLAEGQDGEGGLEPLAESGFDLVHFEEGAPIFRGASFAAQSDDPSPHLWRRVPLSELLSGKRFA